MKILTKWRNFKNIRIKQKETAMMKQLTGTQPINHKEKNGFESNNSPNKKNTPKNSQEENKSKRKNIEEQNEGGEARNKRLENIQRKDEESSIDDEADEQMPVTERGKNSSR